MMNPQIRLATHDDLAAMAALDPLAGEGSHRRSWLAESLEQAVCLVADGDDGIAGFLVLDRRFFGHAFVALLIVRPEARRQGLATALLEAAEALCPTGKFFTSMNVSNNAAQALFRRAGFQPSGMITNLDAGDDEMILYKPVRPT